MILVVDDHRDICTAVVALLTVMRHDARCVTGGQEAIDYLHDATPDLVILDSSMPGVDGMGVLRHLRGDPRLAGVPVVMHSGDCRPETRADIERVGIQGWIVKDSSSYDEIVEAARRYDAPA